MAIAARRERETMPTQISEVVGYLRRSILRQDVAGLTDGQLLGRFLDHRDEAAVAALVQRHGPMVWGVCRRILSNHHDAEDAFQAAFLVLVRKAASIRTNVGNWLYGVAHQTALKARTIRAKRHRRERPVTGMPEPAVTERDLWNDLQPLLDQELSRLPQKYRTVVVLCDLEGRTRKEAARQLGCPEGTVASWLARARALLAKRLSRHGLAITAATLTAALSQAPASANVPPALVSSTINILTLFAAGQAVATGIISGTVATLTEGVLKAMLLNKIKAVATVLCVVAVFGAGVSGLTHRTQAAAQTEGYKQAYPPDDPGTPAGGPPISDKSDKESPRELRGELKLDNVPIRSFTGHGDFVRSVSFSPDGKRALSGSYDETMRLWDVETGKEICRFTGHKGEITSVSFSRDGKLALSGGTDRIVRLWEVQTGKVLRVFAGHKGDVISVTMSPEGKQVLSAGADKTLRLWEVGTGKEVHAFTGHTDSVWTVSFSPDGSRALSGGEDRTLRLWDVETGKELLCIRGHAGWVSSVSFSPDGKRALSTSQDKTVRLWDVETGNEIRCLKGHKGEVTCALFSPDGKRILSGGTDGTLRLWDLATGKELHVFKRDKGIVLSVAFSPDGKRALSGSSDRMMYLWDVAP
jgi:RNA polymerase sigma factor (sigma-70 family)